MNKTERIIKGIVAEKKKDLKVVAILLFGSHARGTATKESDIDIEIIYEGGKYCDVTTKIEGVKVDFETWPKKQLEKRVEEKPYTCYPYLEEKILYDPQGFARALKMKVDDWFRKNPRALKVWKDWTRGYLKSKKDIVKSDKQKVKECEEFYKELEKAFG
ncbi:nucleotidyltransferase domain-containing protein [Candidatus Woesearchaeota archaeon]|nr:nucleotidyltransferase domain-containing protein [Candidatus Woesearchaeota archaeon]